jgi:hypothetical protein
VGASGGSSLGPPGETVKVSLKCSDVENRQVTIIDAALSAAHSSTKNKAGERDPEMHQITKGNTTRRRWLTATPATRELMSVLRWKARRRSFSLPCA